MTRNRSAMIFGWVFLASILALPGAVADDKNARVDELFARWDTRQSPGAALGIIQDGQLVYKRGYGMADLEHDIAIGTTSVFRIGSTSKQFTAACIGILALQGSLSLDDNIRKYLPEIPEYQKPITIRNLIHHTSGLRDYTSLLVLAGFRPDADAPTIEETVALIARQKALNFVPGTMYSYSNSGYFLLSLIVERVSGRPMNDFAQEHIFRPLGMKNTFFHQDHTKIIKNRAGGYSPDEEGYRINMTRWMHVGDGGVYTTVEDMFLWDQAFYHQKLGKSLMALLQSPGSLADGTVLDYAFGLTHGEYRGLKTIGHGGSWVGYRSAILRFPEQNFSVVCLANLSTINPSRLCTEVADIYLEGTFTKPPVEGAPRAGGDRSAREPEGFKLGPAECEEYAGEYYSEELGISYRLVMEGAQLVVKARNASRQPLVAVAPDGFRWSGRSIAFLRDRENRIQGFSLGTGRAQGIAFIRR